MVFDSPEHKQLILEMFEQVSFPGRLVDLIYEVKQAVLGAEVKPKGDENVIP